MSMGIYIFLQPQHLVYSQNDFKSFDNLDVCGDFAYGPETLP
jgi:hypothetical protein